MRNLCCKLISSIAVATNLYFTAQEHFLYTNNISQDLLHSVSGSAYLRQIAAN